MLKQELRNLKSHLFLLSILFGAILIGIIYTAIFVGSMWDPYGKLSNLPVAVVNLDIEADYNGTMINIGQDLIDSLKDDDSLDYKFVGEDVAQTGLENGTYYMIITIPKDFSSNATTVLEEEPKKMELQYQVNPATNFIASKMTNTAAVTMQDSIKKKVTELYAKMVFDSISNAKDGLKKAADGSTKLQDAVKKLSDGTITLADGTSNLLSGVKVLKNGTYDLASGAKKLTAAAEKVDSGVESLESGSGKLVAGYEGDSGAIAGAALLEAGTKQLYEAVSGISLPSIELSKEQKSQITSSISTSKDISDAASQLSSGIGTSVSSSVTSTLTSDKTKMAVSNAVIKDSKIKQAVSALVSTGYYTQEQAESLFVGTVNSTLDAVAGSITADSITSAISPSVSSAITQVAGGAALTGANGIVTEVNKTMGSYNTQLTQLKTATDSLSTGASDLLSGIKTLHDGTVTLDYGLQTLNKGTVSLKSGASDLSSGATELDGATGTLVSGAKDLDHGAVHLQNGASQLSDSMSLSDSLQLGADEIDVISNADDDTYDMFASPVELKRSVLVDVDNNGSSMSPYMMAVALWLVATIFCIGYPTRKHFGETKNGVSWWLSKLPIYTAVCIMSSVVLVFGMKAIWGLQTEYLGRTILFACMVSLAFMSLYYLVTFCLGINGGYYMTIFMAIQLAGCAGTYPIELSGKFYQAIHPFIPFTYVVNGFRKTLFIGTGIGKECAVMAGISIISSLLLILAMHAKLKKEKTIMTIQS